LQLSQPSREKSKTPDLDPGPSPAIRAAAAARLEWAKERRLKQTIPVGAWGVFLALAGRGWGKTRVGAEDAWWFCAANPGVRYAVVAPTHHDLRLVCFEGDSGILSRVPQACLEGGTVDSGYNRSLLQIRFANGSLIQGYSAEVPARLRGPQHHRAWTDEIAAWERLQETWDMLQFGLRLGENPQIIATTTPRPVPLLYRLMERRDSGEVVVASGSTYENEANLARPFIARIKEHEGTELGRQEIHAELVDLDARAILKRFWWRAWNQFGPDGQPDYPTDLLLSFASVDPAYTQKDENDPSACTVWHVYRDEHFRIRILLRYAWEERLEFPDLVSRLAETCQHFGLRRVVIENKASGLSVAQELRRQRREISVFEWTPVGDKVARAHAVAPVLKEGLVRVAARQGEAGPVLQPWARRVIDQCAEFQGGKDDHDDLVDTVTQALQFIRRQGVELFEADAPPPPARSPRRRIY
jgi:predicted phage terminase large subunit-like protein